MGAAANELDVINLCLDDLGQDELTQADLAAAIDGSSEDDNAIACHRNYDPVRLGLQRRFPWEFCEETLPMVPVDPNGLVIEAAAVEDCLGEFSFDELWTHESNDVRVSGESGAWLIGNAEGTQIYYTSSDAVSKPWDVSLWLPGDNGAAPVPRIYPGTPRDYSYLYKRPADCLTPWKIWNPASRKPDDKIRFKPFRNNWIACDLDDAVLVYARDEADVTLFDSLFVLVFAKSLAVAVHNKIKGTAKTKAELKQELADLLLLAEKVDASEQHENHEALLGRRYIDL